LMQVKSKLGLGQGPSLVTTVKWYWRDDLPSSRGKDRLPLGSKHQWKKRWLQIFILSNHRHSLCTLKNQISWWSSIRMRKRSEMDIKKIEIPMKPIVAKGNKIFSLRKPNSYIFFCFCQTTICKTCLSRWHKTYVTRC